MAQIILVTGSNSGFGRLTVETLARQGHSVFAGMRGVEGKNRRAAEDIRTLAKREQLALDCVELDITDDVSVEQAIKSIVGISGRLDVVVNNAGMSYVGPLEAFSIEQVQQQFDTNVFGTWRVNRAAIPQMRQQKSGLLLQIGSIVGRIALPFLGLYGATKFALESLTDSYRYELAPFGIDVAIIQPGTYPTPIAAKSPDAADKERMAHYQSAIDGFMQPFFMENKSDRPPNSQEVADAVAKVISQPAGARTAHTVVAPAAQRQAPQAVNDAVEQANQAFFTSLKLPRATIASKKEKAKQSS